MLKRIWLISMMLGLLSIVGCNARPTHHLLPPAPEPPRFPSQPNDDREAMPTPATIGTNRSRDQRLRERQEDSLQESTCQRENNPMRTHG